MKFYNLEINKNDLVDVLKEWDTNGSIGHDLSYHALAEHLLGFIIRKTSGVEEEMDLEVGTKVSIRSGDYYVEGEIQAVEWEVDGCIFKVNDKWYLRNEIISYEK